MKFSIALIIEIEEDHSVLPLVEDMHEDAVEDLMRDLLYDIDGAEIIKIEVHKK